MDCRINYKSSYLVKQNPRLFGGKQEDYLVRANQTIQAAANKIKLGKERGVDLKKLFFEVIADLSKQRGFIAKDHKPGSEKIYGLRRDECIPGYISATTLAGIYEKYGAQTLNCFSKYLTSMQSDGEFKKEHLIQDVCQERTTTLCIQVLDSAEMRKKGFFKSSQSYLPAYISKDERFANEDEWTKEEIVEFREKYRQFMSEFPEAYWKKRVVDVLWMLYEKFPPHTAIENMRSLYVYAELRSSVAGELYKITDYLTWMYETKDPASHPINRMKECSKVLVLHQDEFLIKPTLEEISKLFESAVNWNRKTESLQDLKDIMTPLLYLATHNMRDVRGGAAENEWLEQAIYGALDVSMIRPEDRLVDLEAFANPMLSDFKKAYDEMTDLRLSSFECTDSEKELL